MSYTNHVSILTLLIEQFTRLTHGHSDESTLTTAGSSAAEHLLDTSLALTLLLTAASELLQGFYSSRGTESLFIMWLSTLSTAVDGLMGLDRARLINGIIRGRMVLTKEGHGV